MLKNELVEINFKASMEDYQKSETYRAEQQKTI